MTAHALFLKWTAPPPRAGDGRAGPGAARMETDALFSLLQARQDCAAADFYEPVHVSDPVLGETPDQAWMLRLDFNDAQALRQAAGPGGWAGQLCRAPWLGPLRDCELSAQAMLCRTAPASPAPGAPRACAYVAGYEGNPSDPEAWVAGYLDGHVPLMRRLPGLREAAVFTRLEGEEIAVPGRPLRWLLRNHAVFDSAADLAAALQSPVRRELREHRACMPPAGGQNEHLPMLMRRSRRA